MRKKPIVYYVTFRSSQNEMKLTSLPTGPACPTCTGSSVVEQMPANGMVVGSSPTSSVGFPTGLAAASV